MNIKISISLFLKRFLEYNLYFYNNLNLKLITVHTCYTLIDHNYIDYIS